LTVAVCHDGISGITYVELKRVSCGQSIHVETLRVL
jgi:hypothetical protein